MQVFPEVESQPDQPPTIEPLAAVALSVTDVPAGSVSEQSFPQSMPVPATLPAPAPLLATVRVWVGFVLAASNAAVTVRFVPRTTVQELPELESQPDQPVNDEPELAVAVSVTDVPADTVAEHWPPHSMPVPWTLPLPGPVLATVTV